MRYLILALLLVGCGEYTTQKSHGIMRDSGLNKVVSSGPLESDGRLVPYQRRIQAALGTKGVTVVFDHLPEWVGAQCNRSVDGNVWISVNQYNWMNPPEPYYLEYIEEYREMIMFHENGHCALQLQHRNDEVNAPKGEWPSLTPNSLMASGVSINPKLYQKYKNDFVRELLTGELIFKE